MHLQKKYVVDRIDDRHSEWIVLMTGTLICGYPTKAEFDFGQPVEVPNINSETHDSRPQISRDGLELYFLSHRNHVEGECYEDIWVSRRATTNHAWSAPVRLAAPVKSPRPESAASLSADGLELYFADGIPVIYGDSTCGPNPEGIGYSDLWVTTRASKDEPWGTPENLGPYVNGPFNDDMPCISADGCSLYFMSDRQGTYGGTDIYVTTRENRDAPWGWPRHLSYTVNSGQWEHGPFISPDGRTLFFSRGNMGSDIYMSRRSTTSSPWQPAMRFGPTASDWQAEICLSFSEADSKLYFSRGAYLLSHDHKIWQLEVSPITDLDLDGIVGAKDISVLLDHWNQNSDLYDIGPRPIGDGVVGDEDLMVLYGHVDGNLAPVPTPALCETGVAPFVGLRWTRGAFARKYDVYFGESISDVLIADRDRSLDTLISQDQTANTYNMDEALEFGKMYHWRVDEVNDLSNPSIVKGVVWSFTTEPGPGPITRIVATASSADEGTDPEHTIDGSGLDSAGLHGTDPETMWVSAADGPQPAWIQYEFDRPYPLDTLHAWNHNSQFEQFFGIGFNDVTVEYSQDGLSWTYLDDVQFAQGTSMSNYACNTVVDFGGVTAKCVRLTALSNWRGLTPRCGLSEVRFFYVPPHR